MKTTSLAFLAGMAITLSPLPVFAQTAPAATEQAGLGINVEAEMAALQTLASMDPAAAVGAFSSLVDRIAAAAVANPDLAALAAETISGAVAKMGETLTAAGMPEAALAEALAGMTSAATGALSQVGTVAPDIAGAAMAAVAMTVAAVAAQSFTTPHPELSAALASLAESLPPGTSPEVVAQVGTIAGAVSSGDYAAIGAPDGPKSASGN